MLVLLLKNILIHIVDIASGITYITAIVLLYVSSKKRIGIKGCKV